ncbi:MAG: hypothetical protein GY752_00250 [bacterium]|nr:hypothetical protein [bacterium]MCP4801084.1 hypothetical protein [bacterium]
MNYRTYAIVSGIVFGVIALGHLIRLIFQMPIQIGTSNLPMWVSVLAVILSASLYLWAFREARKIS